MKPMNHYNGLPLMRKLQTNYELNSSLGNVKRKPGLKPLSTEYVPPPVRKITDPVAIKMQECYVIKHENPSFEKAYQIMKKKQRKLNKTMTSQEGISRCVSRDQSPYRRGSPLGRPS